MVRVVWGGVRWLGCMGRSEVVRVVWGGVRWLGLYGEE